MIDAEKITSLIKKATKRSGDITDFKNKCNILNQKQIPYFKVVVGSKAYIIRKNNDYVYMFHPEWTNNNLGGICRRASMDANKFLKNFDVLEQKPYHPIVDYNHKVIKESVGSIVKSIDMKSCYWNIAKKLGIISDKTYEIGLDEPKESRLIALGTFSKSILITEVHNGKSVDRLNHKTDKLAVWYRILQEVESIYNKTTDIVGLDNYLMFRTDQIIFNQSKTSDLTKWYYENNITTRKDTIQLLNFEKSTLSGIYLNKPITPQFNVFVPSFSRAVQI